MNVINSKTKNKSQVDTNLAREIYNEEYGFTIETDFVKYIEDMETGYHSYSFPMKRDYPVDEKIENLLFHFNEKGTYDVYIVKYGFTKEEYEILDIEYLDNLSTKFTSIIFDEIEFTTDEPQSLTVELVCVEDVVWNDGTPHNGQVHGADCTCTPDDQGWEIVNSECTWMNTGGTGSDGNNTYPNGDTNGTGDYTPGGTPTGVAVPQYPIISTPIVLLPWQEVVQCVNGLNETGTIDETLLTPQMVLDIQGDKYLANQINNFLEENNCSEEAQEVIIGSLLILITNTTFSFHDAIVEFLLNNLTEEEIDEYDWFEDSILGIDIRELMNCFQNLDLISADATYSFTVYVEQPIPNTNATHDGTDPGHTFVSMSITDPNIPSNNITQTFGYYPGGDVNPVIGDNTSFGEIRNNSGHNYHVSVGISLDNSSFYDLVNAFDQFGNDIIGYNLNTYNCTDFGLSFSNLVGMNLPDTEGTWSIDKFGIEIELGGGSNPGNLGQDIRNLNDDNLEITITTGNNAPIGSGPCD